MKEDVLQILKKMKILTYAILAILVFISKRSIAQNDSIRTKGLYCCESIYFPTQFDTLSLKELGKEYKRLKKLNCEDCDRSSSDFYDIMMSLGEKLNGKSKKEVIKIMGRPDSKEGKTYIYDWRDGHDYLYFEFVDNKANSNWYYAYE